MVQKVAVKHEFEAGHRHAAVSGYLFQSKVGKKAGNTHISQDGGKYW